MCCPFQIQIGGANFKHPGEARIVPPELVIFHVKINSFPPDMPIPRNPTSFTISILLILPRALSDSIDTTLILTLEKSI